MISYTALVKSFSSYSSLGNVLGKGTQSFLMFVLLLLVYIYYDLFSFDRFAVHKYGQIAVPLRSLATSPSVLTNHARLGVADGSPGLFC
jgi:hypothetical protein